MPSFFVPSKDFFLADIKNLLCSSSSGSGGSSTINVIATIINFGKKKRINVSRERKVYFLCSCSTWALSRVDIEQQTEEKNKIMYVCCSRFIVVLSVALIFFLLLLVLLSGMEETAEISESINFTFFPEYPFKKFFRVGLLRWCEHDNNTLGLLLLRTSSSSLSLFLLLSLF